MRLPWWVPLGAVPEIEAGILFQRLMRGEALQLLDVRSDREFDKGRLKGALHLGILEFPRRWQALGLDKSRPVIVICLTAHRSIPAVRQLRTHGFDAFQLRGGMRAWRESSLPEVMGPPLAPRR